MFPEHFSKFLEHFFSFPEFLFPSFQNSRADDFVFLLSKKPASISCIPTSPITSVNKKAFILKKHSRFCLFFLIFGLVLEISEKLIQFSRTYEGLLQFFESLFHRFFFFFYQLWSISSFQIWQIDIFRIFILIMTMKRILTHNSK